MEIDPRRGAPTVRLDDPVADDVARAHDTAARILGGVAARSPDGLEAGVAGPGVRAILAALAGATTDLGGVNRLLADAVRDSARDLGGADARVAATFRESAEAVT